MTVIPIQLLRSSVENKRPIPSDLLPGQPAVNTNAQDPGLFFSNASGSALVKVGPCSIGPTAPNTSPPSGGSSGNSKGEFWFDTVSDILKVWSGTEWKDCGNSGEPAVEDFSYTTPTLAPGASHDFDIGIGRLYQILTVGANRPSWVRVFGNSTGRSEDTRVSPGLPFPPAGSGYFTEVVTTASAPSVFMSPIPSVQQQTDRTYFTVKNNDVQPRSITITFSVYILIP